MVPVSLCDGVGELVSDAVAEYEGVGLDVSDREIVYDAEAVDEADVL